MSWSYAQGWVEKLLPGCRKGFIGCSWLMLNNIETTFCTYLYLCVACRLQFMITFRVCILYLGKLLWGFKRPKNAHALTLVPCGKYYGDRSQIVIARHGGKRHDLSPNNLFEDWVRVWAESRRTQVARAPFFNISRAMYLSIGNWIFTIPG